MAAPAGPYLPTNELVAVAWLGQRVPGITDDMVATTLPRAAGEPPVLPWADNGFVQVQAVAGGTPDVDIPVRHPILQVDCWAAAAQSSAKPLWNRANRLAELIRDATERHQDGWYGKPVTLPEGYLGARVQAVYLISEPMRMNGDPSGFARFSFDLAVDWVRVQP